MAECREQSALLARAADHMSALLFRVKCAEEGHEGQRRNTLAFMRERDDAMSLLRELFDSPDDCGVRARVQEALKNDQP
jgi:hypothetical protein